MEREKQVDESWKDAAAAEKDLLNAAAAAVDQGSASKLIIDEDVVGKESVPEPAETSSEDGDEIGDMEVTFLNYVTSLGFQAMIFLGEVPHPVSNQIEKNTDQAKFIIDTLLMIREKTKGNLDSREENLLNASIYELQMKYVDVIKS
jgi:hypothetical protein